MSACVAVATGGGRGIRRAIGVRFALARGLRCPAGG